jgi:hypothetical protein
MSQPEKPETQQIVDDGREPYEAPRLEIEELYEVLALTCGKTHFNQGQCRRVMRNS